MDIHTITHSSQFYKREKIRRKSQLTCSASSFLSKSMIKRTASGNRTTTSFSLITFWTSKPWKLMGWLSPAVHSVRIKRTNCWSKSGLRCLIKFSIKIIRARHRGLILNYSIWWLALKQTSLMPGAIFSAGSSLAKPLAFAVSTASSSVLCNLRTSCVVALSPSLRDVW